MKRRTLNSLAVLVTLMGAFHLSAPPSARAAEAACCDGIRSDCCGAECKLDTAGNCTSCNGFWQCLFF